MIKMLADLLSGEGLLPCLQMAVRAIPKWQREQKESELFLFSSSKSTSLILEGSDLINLITSQRCHFLTSLHGGLWFQQMILRGIHSEQNTFPDLVVTWWTIRLVTCWRFSNSYSNFVLPGLQSVHIFLYLAYISKYLSNAYYKPEIILYVEM